MPTQERFPTGDSTTNNAMTPSSGVDKYAMVDDDPHDSDTTYVYLQDSAGQQGFTFPAFSLGAVSSINGVTVHAVTRESVGDVRLRLGLVVNGTTYFTGDILLASAYAEYSNTWLTNPDTGSAWTKAALENDIEEMVIRFTSLAAGEEARATQVKAVADYNPAGAEKLLLLGVG